MQVDSVNSLIDCLIDCLVVVAVVVEPSGKETTRTKTACGLQLIVVFV